MYDNYIIAALIVYLLAGRLAMRHLTGRVREVVVALVHLLGTFVVFFYFTPYNDSCVSKFLDYVAMVILQFILFRCFWQAKGWLPWIAFFAPLAFLVAVRYLPLSAYTFLGHLIGKHLHQPSYLGLSYLAFRNSRLVLEVRNGTVKAPGLWEYLGYSFFLPTISLGPINTYANYRRAFEATPWETPLIRALFRILVGWVKYEFLSCVFGQLDYSGLLLNGHLHAWTDLPVAMVFYYLFLYCNFSGFCDMAIGAAALMGIPVLENFDNPFAARNIKDFWNRWHITLSVWMRDVVFSPLSKYLVGRLGPANANHAIALTITVVFLLVGIWHGVGWHYAIYGAIHAFGLVANHYYTIFLKKRLGREGFKAYNENRWIRAAATVLTFLYCAGSLMFFANTLPQIREIFSILR